MTDPAREAAERIAPCCKTRWRLPDIGPIFFNQYNDTVQCHNCGATFDQRALPTAGDREALARIINCALPFPAGFDDDDAEWRRALCYSAADAILTWMSASGFRRDGVKP